MFKVFILMKILLSKLHIKVLREISLVYTLQIFAVILLFFSVGSTSADKAKKNAVNIGLPLLIDNNDFLNFYKDSSLTEKAEFYGKPIDKIR